MKPKKTSHFFHAIFTLFFCGLWLPVWIICHKMNEKYNQDLAFRNELIKANFEAGKARNNLDGRASIG
jgi:hypothetical protein